MNVSPRFDFTVDLAFVLRDDESADITVDLIFELSVDLNFDRNVDASLDITFDTYFSGFNFKSIVVISNHFIKLIKTFETTLKTTD